MQDKDLPFWFCSYCGDSFDLCVVVCPNCVHRQWKDVRIAELENLVVQLTQVLTLDCGDNSCYFASNRQGQRTNGGCRCLRYKEQELSKRFKEALNVVVQHT